MSEILEKESTVDLKELTDTQKQVLSIWQDIIKAKSIGINDNFFDAGGTSFLAVRVVDRIEKELNVSLGLREFFFSPKIQSLAELIEWQKNPKRAPERTAEMQQNKAGDKIITGEL